ncbi:hypothetical protein M2323_002935 [Rhodoblastus acidophilus]|uniref:hypothetical protein n=1 Tax=Rhodoblastus acidophilus TaxID=1074 RepID=UPI0022240C4E|nr:hypothetical protein [Rhodoblastus acidophilus]MCW2284938.1 hypothetical protein [Rhodoblastus acidophilus]MCW2333998.1 hypothetical protein [Rhodoblastus acidophilus]
MTKIQGWTTHGETAQTKLLAGILPPRGIHALTGPDAATNTALAADLAVALAAGDVGCGLGLPDANGTRASLAGFFGNSIGEPGGVAIIAANRGKMAAAVEAAALARGVTVALPIAIASASGDLRGLTDGTVQLYRVRDELPRHLRLLIVEAGVSHDPIRRSALHSALTIAESVCGCAVLFVTQDWPAGIAGAESVVLEAATDRLTLAQPPVGVAGWTRAFRTSRILLAGREAIAIQPGAILPHTPNWKAVAPAAAPVPAAEVEREVTSRAVIFVTGRALTQEEIAPWAAYRNVRNEVDALPNAGEPNDGGVREIVIVPNDRDHRAQEAEIRRFKLEQEAKSRGVDGRVVIKISERCVAA